MVKKSKSESKSKREPVRKLRLKFEKAAPPKRPLEDKDLSSKEELAKIWDEDLCE